MIRRSIVAFVVLAASCVDPAFAGPPGFLEGCTVGIAADHPTQHPVFFVNTYTGAGMTTHNVWHEVDVSGLVPPDAVAVNLHTLMGITNGASGGTANLVMYVRRPGAPHNGNYHTQVIDVGVSGQRTSDSVWVPVTKGRFEVSWTASLGSPWPTGPAFFINTKLVAYLGACP